MAVAAHVGTAVAAGAAAEGAEDAQAAGTVAVTATAVPTSSRCFTDQAEC